VSLVRRGYSASFDSLVATSTILPRFEDEPMADHTPYQKKIIKRYYKNFNAIQYQRLSEMVTELYLAEGKKQDRLWAQVADALGRLDFPPTRIEHLLQKRDPALLPGILQELSTRQQ
jgi:hypothetical protein